MKDCGAKADKKDIDTMISKLKGKDIPKLIEEGMGKFAAIGGGGGAAPAEAAPVEAPKEEKKETKKEKEEAKKEESDDVYLPFGDEEEY